MIPFVLVTKHKNRLQKEVILMADNKSLAERALQIGMDKIVSVKLNEIGRDMSDMSKSMSPTEIKEFKLMLLGMGEASCKTYFAKMRSRIERQDEN